MNLHKGLISALWRLPAEVLSKKIDFYLLDSGHLSQRSEPIPLLLTKVCRRWRDVAVGIPKLWCRLFFHAYEDHREWRRAAFYYNSWLKR
ncbi:hypothetical protein DFH29DRAFT_893609 [Suillus ampliporus]|nr:hypothetical protein DFH29DRAFT_893609 [Suillus ampliporus]